jgi:hypothetical protein
LLRFRVAGTILGAEWRPGANCSGVVMAGAGGTTRATAGGGAGSARGGGPGRPRWIRILEEAAEEVRDLLCRSGPLWPELVREARRLIEEARGPAGPS